MAEEEGGGGQNEEIMGMATTATSPTEGKGKVKFFCSHGGKILPRPSDGTLKYVGGETRVVAVPRTITFTELMKKINDQFDGEYIFKYQLAREDLDSLVSVKSDEDIRHMFDEYDRLEKKESGAKLRAFLFPIKPSLTEHHHQSSLSVLGPHALEQRFVDAINGVVRNTNIISTSRPPLNNNSSSSSTRLKSYSPSPTDGSSPQSLSPRSNNGYNYSNNQEHSANLISSLQSRLTRMHKVQSSPSLCNLGVINQQNASPAFANCYITQQPNYQHCGYKQGTLLSPNMPQDHQHINSHLSGYQSPTQRHDHHHNYNHHHAGYQSPTNSTQDHNYVHQMLGGSEFGKVSFGYGPVAHHNLGYYHPLLRGYPGSGGHSRWGHLEQYANVACGNRQLMRATDTQGSTSTWE